MQVVNIHQAKTNLSRLLEGVAQGEPFIIAKAGKPVAQVLPLDCATGVAPQRLGFLAGKIQVPEDFDTLHAETIAQLFQTGG